MKATLKGYIVVDDVWIGYNVTVLSEFRIGQGAVVVIGSIATKGVSSYAIVVGNPAHVIRYRLGKGITNE